MKTLLLFISIATAFAEDLPCERDRTDGFIMCTEGVYQRKSVYLGKPLQDLRGCKYGELPGSIICPDGNYDLLFVDDQGDRTPEGINPQLSPPSGPKKSSGGKKI